MWAEGLARAYRAPDADGEGPLLPISSRPQRVLALGEVARMIHIVAVAMASMEASLHLVKRPGPVPVGPVGGV